MIDTSAPLAERMRPRTLDEIIGREDVVGPETALGKILRSKTGVVPSMVFWGPPGTGKTTLARVIAAESRMRFIRLSGVLDGVKEIRAAVEGASKAKEEHGQRTLALVDEIHRFNRSQQDAFLPHVESGLLTIIGQTTDNVSFRISSALLSRMRVVLLPLLSEPAVCEIVQNALVDSDRGLGKLMLGTPPETMAAIVHLAAGDARRALNALEWSAVLASDAGRGDIFAEDVHQAYGKQPLQFDQQGDKHYDYVSAFIKSMRGSDPDAAMYYLVRALESGEDPLFVSRRMIIFASEDASCDPRALELAINVDQAVQRVGMPEAKIPLAHAACYLASCPKSNASYVALQRAEKLVADHPESEVPLHLRNAPTSFLKEAGHGKGYKYPHDYPGAFVTQEYLPSALKGIRLYEPKDQGIDTAIRERLARLHNLSQNNPQNNKQNNSSRQGK